MSQELLAMGAESSIYKENNAVKKVRHNKSYRHPIIDKKLIKSRTKREAKIINTLQNLNVPVPKLLHQDENTLTISYIDAKPLKDVLEQNISLIKKVAKITTTMHENSIIHGDLTTSNILANKNDELTLIDFGLSFVSHKIEDKAVDLHLLKQALNSKHYKIHDEAWQLFLDEYNPKDKKDILLRLEKVEARGRNKG